MSARNRFSVLPTPFSAPSALQYPHLPFCLELTHTHKYASISSATSVQLDQFPQSFLIHTNSTNNANEPPLNYFLSLSHKEQFGVRAGGGERALLLSLVPPTHPPALQKRLTSQNLITLLTCPICSVAGRQGFNYICSRHAGEP